jgi:mannobiose 2-epimerase
VGGRRLGAGPAQAVVWAPADPKEPRVNTDDAAPTGVTIDRLAKEMAAHRDGLARFWLERATDPTGSFRTSFDDAGRPVAEPVKSLVAQTRVLWTVAELARATGQDAFQEMGARGLEWMVRAFRDTIEGGWYWTCRADGTALDRAKIVYGQSFALYALATYAGVFRDGTAAALAQWTFDSLERAIDAHHGGYFENLDRFWIPEDTPSGRRKSLDNHLQLLEALTVFAALTGSERHRRRLAQVRDLVLDIMVDQVAGAGRNQFSVDWTPELPIVIDRTWIAERVDEPPPPPGFFTTSYGHNLELGWLLGCADRVLEGSQAVHSDLVAALADHALAWGYDHRWGGVYREGPMTGPASDRDKEFWQNAEALIGFLHAYQLTGQARFFDAFAGTWDFARQHLIHTQLAEWRIRTTRAGATVDPALGNQWTGGYHTVRAAVECTARLEALSAGTGLDV